MYLPFLKSLNSNDLRSPSWHLSLRTHGTLWYVVFLTSTSTNTPNFDWPQAVFLVVLAGECRPREGGSVLVYYTEGGSWGNSLWEQSDNQGCGPERASVIGSYCRCYCCPDPPHFSLCSEGHFLGGPDSSDTRSRSELSPYFSTSKKPSWKFLEPGFPCRCSL